MYRNKTPQSTPLKNTHGIRPLLGRCDDPNHRWWTGAKRARFTFLAFVAALTKVRPPFCVPIDRVFHPVCKGAPDSNLVYPLSLILCLPPPVARSGRHRHFDRGALVKRGTTAAHHVPIVVAPHPQPTHPFQNTFASHFYSAIAFLGPTCLVVDRCSGAFRASGRPSKGPPRD